MGERKITAAMIAYTRERNKKNYKQVWISKETKEELDSLREVHRMPTIDIIEKAIKAWGKK